MPSEHDTITLYAKYMALKYESGSNAQAAALDLAKRVLKLPIQNSRDLSVKLKILETEISALSEIKTATKYHLLELLALVAQADLVAVTTDKLPVSQTKH